MPRSWSLFIFSIGICLAAGVAGSLFTFQSIPTWYTGLEKPFFSPPNWVFAPVWTILYILMGISLYLVLSSKKKLKHEAVGVFMLQLGFNVFWSVLFFGMRNPTLALLDILALWMSIFVTIHLFGKISKLASMILIPYILWVSFAFILNLVIVLLN
ncbi:TspO protein [Candidatus Gottesmanbacteria bacterium RIFCSPHIGHO2_01_FULL_39_10]|uniref:TspO protein n=1 Tax=Candidatus Gottesmanbacteria bacterium RIFCSPHIGHO2_01_FULL_39_10 TaxID=1798375 RepID=A0A1F5ZRA5_9BACT|nr:MAG: TspO protein [Candidatus Gottesmanbacteria bacterium RIFCSPHIGHO2_01_FULL_39_10]